ncbi:MAG: peptide deformylase [Ignavibacteria bacterium]|jgi:peptide deformylase|nr:peptide deformylase [Ignavibacteria bacterium]MCU7502905.1 peptide deformylase [Ignavibacteria bacterium]MCU7515601.1 peptide deformylase [Ignavibacteria bacterium]
MKKLFILFTCILFISGCAGAGNVNKESQFSDEQKNLIMSADSSTVMRVLSIFNRKDSLLLRSKSQDVIAGTNDAALQNLVKRMYATVNDSLNAGVGIAAPQVGILKNIIWVQRYDKPGYPFEVYFNPRIKQYTKQKIQWVEGCLSVPGMKDTTRTRSFAILLEYDRPDKSHNLEMVEGFTAVIFQHEIDHLNGIIYLDRRRK